MSSVGSEGKNCVLSLQSVFLPLRQGNAAYGGAATDPAGGTGGARDSRLAHSARRA